MMTPDDIDVWVGLDVGKSAHHAHALDHDGNTPPQSAFGGQLPSARGAIFCSGSP